MRADPCSGAPGAPSVVLRGLAFVVLIGPIVVGLVGTRMYTAVADTLLYTLLLGVGGPTFLALAVALIRRPTWPAELGIMTVRGGPGMRHAMNLLLAALVAGGAGFGTAGGAYLLNGGLGEQTLLRVPCTVTDLAAQSTRRSMVEGKVYCRTDNGDELGLTLWSEAEAEAAQARLSPGARIEVQVYEGSLGLRYTTGSPVAAMPAAAD